jgi:solute carrier family 9B (sodium/hydrogen exchanger), member 1/2
MIPLRLRTRIGLGLAPIPRPGLAALLPLGLVLGPAGLNLLSDSVLSYLDPVVSVSLVALGIFAGLDVNFRRPREGALLAAASVEAGVTTLLAGGAMLVALSRFALEGPPVWQIATMLGIAAAVSSTSSSASADRASSLATRVGDLDDVLAIVLGGVVLASTGRGFSFGAVSLVVQAALIALAIAGAGWLLVAQTPAEGDQHVFVAGSLLLLGGAAAYLSLSGLWIGFVGGILWGASAGSARDNIDRNMKYLQHPLMVLLLLVAGARLKIGIVAVALAAVYLTCRVAGKLLGGLLARAFVLQELPVDLGRRLLAPGVMAVAFALNVLQAAGPSEATTMLMSVAVLGSLGSELLSILPDPQRREP